MSVPEYKDCGPIVPFPQQDLSSLVGKSIIITGGASGLGRAYATAFVAAGAFVTIGDLNEPLGSELTKELSATNKGGVQFVKCDVRIWEDQVALFTAATQNSPHKSCDVVIGNAGIAVEDSLVAVEDPDLPPVKPDLRTIDINVTGLLYTAKLAMHYFRRQPINTSRDRCLILKSSLAGYIDMPSSPQYNTSKFGCRGLMRSLRRTSWSESIRVNLVAPWIIATPIVPPGIAELLAAAGTEFALEDDATKAMLRIASDQTVNGRALGVVPRRWVSDGWLDLDTDDIKEGESHLKLWEKFVVLASKPRSGPVEQYQERIVVENDIQPSLEQSVSV